MASSNGGAQSGAVPTSSGNIGNLKALASGGDPTATPQGGTITPGSLPTATNPTPVNLASSPNTSLGAAGSLLTPYSGSFTAPTAAEAEQTPGYQFQQQQGQQALQQSAAARGNLLTGGTAEALDNYSQGLAASNYQNVYNNAYNTYASNYNQYQNQQANTFNRLSALAGGGQTAASTLGTLGQSAANSVTSNELGTAGQIGQDVQNAGA
ncbi:MAG: hypothetical protein ACRETL_15615, partial [Gammaproteobacteria bacterium]